MLGVRLALDDFGTGWSPLGCLDRYEIDAVKVDRSVVARMPGQGRATAILDGIVRLGLALNLDVVAEGVAPEGNVSSTPGSRSGCRRQESC